jgi:HTH-type transcriptional regulator, transcriptional repressor of NAD biosynthesis genes
MVTTDARFERGLVLGAFLPPTAGLDAVIRSAQARCVHLTVAVADLPGQVPETHDRASWLQAIHPDVDVVVVPDNCGWHGLSPCIDTCASSWAEQLELLGSPSFDVLVTAEPFGPTLAATLGATHQDAARLPNEAAIRLDLSAHWARLHPVVRAGMFRRIAIVGAESTGTTTLSRDLAARLGAPLTYEAGRVMSWSLAARVGGIEKIEWTEHDFFRILEEQRRVEADATARAVDRPFGPLGPWVVCDTDALATVVWWERYLDSPSDAALRFANARLAEAYVITSPHHVDFHQDGVRDGEHVRFAMHRRFVELAAESGQPYLEVSGSAGERVEQVLAWLAAVEAGLPRFATGYSHQADDVP